LGRPSVVGVGEGVAQSLAGKLLTVDGEGGRVYIGEMPMVETRISDDPWLTQFARWAQDCAPIEVVESATGEVLDLDMAGFGVGIEGSTIDLVGLTSALAGAHCVRGSLLSTPDGMRAALDAGVSRVVARPVLPVQVLAVRVAREN
jgi:pyruvate,orthophosphate dikinase